MADARVDQARAPSSPRTSAERAAFVDPAEAGTVVGQHPRRQTPAGRCGGERLHRQCRGRCAAHRADQGADQDPGVVVEHVEDGDRCRRRSAHSWRRSAAPLGSVVTRCHDALGPFLRGRADLARPLAGSGARGHCCGWWPQRSSSATIAAAPRVTGELLAQPQDLQLHTQPGLARTGVWSPRPRRQPGRALDVVAALEPVVGLPGIPSSAHSAVTLDSGQGTGDHHGQPVGHRDNLCRHDQQGSQPGQLSPMSRDINVTHVPRSDKSSLQPC